MPGIVTMIIGTVIHQFFFYSFLHFFFYLLNFKKLIIESDFLKKKYF